MKPAFTLRMHLNTQITGILRQRLKTHMTGKRTAADAAAGAALFGHVRFLLIYSDFPHVFMGRRPGFRNAEAFLNPGTLK